MTGKVLPACVGLIDAAAQSSLKRGEEEEEELAFLSLLTSTQFLWQELPEDRKASIICIFPLSPLISPPYIV